MNDPAREYDPAALSPAPSVQGADPRKPRGKDKAKRKRRRKPTRDELIDNAREALRNRPSQTLESGEDALRVWWGYRHGGGAPKDPRPREIGRESPLEGEPYEVQVARFVEETAGFDDWRAGRVSRDAFAQALDAHLPETFQLPWRGLCKAEREAWALRDVPDGEPKEDRQGDGRLLPGMRRSE